MKGIVVYYSATGNTRKIAMAIHRGMKEVMEECDIASIREADPRDMARYDLIGIGGPIWYFRETANLRLFIHNMPELKGKLCFPFCVHGAAPSGFMFSIVPALKRKGLTIIGYNDWYGSVYQVLHMPKPYLTDGHPDEIDLEEAENFGREMAVRAGRIASGETQLIPELPKGKKAHLLWRPPAFSRRPPSPGEPGGAGPPDRPKPQRTINTERCTYPECTICVENCPVNSIDFSVSPPIIKQNCINCSLCERVCPVGAVEVDAETRKRQSQKIINMDKCLYPKCTLCVDNCPMNSIDFSVTPPVFKHNCEHDDLCWVLCPEGAIEIPNVEIAHGPMSVRDDNHPFAKLLEEEEASGRFRRLVPLDQVGWGNIIYKMKKHPIYVIEEEGNE